MPIRRNIALAGIASAALIGIILGRHGWQISSAAAIVIFAGVLSFWARRQIIWVLLLASFILGIWRGHTSHEQSLALQRLVGQTITLSATIADDPATNAKGVTTFTVDHLRVRGKELSGSLPVYIYPVRVHRGFQVQLQGKIKPGYGKYQAELSYPKLIVISSRQSELEMLRQSFFAGMRTALPEPAASFALGLLVGIRALIPKDMQSTLALVGLSHLVAVSGYNLTIIVSAIERLLARFGRGIALVGSLWIIAGFLAVTGASPSVVRAAVISVLILLATFYGRKFQPLILLLLAAAATALVKPDYLTDLGWLLSFLAFFGILILVPAIWRRFGQPKSILVRLLTESLCAQIMTLPLILFIFGQLSIVAPLTNLLILPLVPFAMAACFVAGLAGMMIPAWCGWLAWPAHFVVWVMLKVIDAFAALSWAGTTIYFDASTMALAYIGLGIITATLHYSPRARISRLSTSPPPSPTDNVITSGFSWPR